MFILTPDYLHAPLLEKAIKAGKHVFIEKPAALTAPELKPLIELDRDNSKIVFVGYMRRFAPAFTALKERLPPRDEIRHVRIRDLIRESQFFVDQTRNIVKPTDVPAELIAEGRSKTQALLRIRHGRHRLPEQVRAYQVLTGLSSHSFSAMRELFGSPRGVAAARQHRGENVLVMFDYGSFTALYEAVIHDVARFDAGIEVLTLNQHFKINYDTPYVRNLPTRLEITTSDLHSTGTEIVGPFYEDAFRIELSAFHHAVTTGEKPKTRLLGLARRPRALRRSRPSFPDAGELTPRRLSRGGRFREWCSTTRPAPRSCSGARHGSVSASHSLVMAFSPSTCMSVA